MEGEGAVWVEKVSEWCVWGGMDMCVAGVGWGGRGYNRSHWNVEMCVCKRPVNSCLK